MAKAVAAAVMHSKSVAALDIMLSEVCASIPVAKMALEQEMIHLMPNLAGTQETLLANGVLVATVTISMPILYIIDKKIVGHVYAPLYNKMAAYLGELRR